jgi:hypothetical protein
LVGGFSAWPWLTAWLVPHAVSTSSPATMATAAFMWFLLVGVTRSGDTSFGERRAAAGQENDSAMSTFGQDLSVPPDPTRQSNSSMWESNMRNARFSEVKCLSKGL